MSIFDKNVSDKEVSSLIAEQERKDEGAIKRREWCIAQAAYVCDERPADLIRTAAEIYRWIYGVEP